MFLNRGNLQPAGSILTGQRSLPYFRAVISEGVKKSVALCYRASAKQESLLPRNRWSGSDGGEQSEMGCGKSFEGVESEESQKVVEKAWREQMMVVQEKEPYISREVWALMIPNKISGRIGMP